MRTFKAAPNHLGDIWSSTALHGDRPYLVNDEDLLYRRARHGSWTSLLVRERTPGDRVVIAMRNIYALLLGDHVGRPHRSWHERLVGRRRNGLCAKGFLSKVLICDEERLHRFEKIRADFPDLKYSPCVAMGSLKTRGLKQH